VQPSATVYDVRPVTSARAASSRTNSRSSV